MPYIYHDKNKDIYGTARSIPKLAIVTGLSVHTLKHNFTREKKDRYERDGIVMVKE